MAVRSDAFLEGDACTHYMDARAAFAAPIYLVNVWGRPICTALYAVPAHLGGRAAARMTSLAVAVAMALVCRSIARGQGWRWPALAVILTLAQPLVFLHSFAELTELPFALLMAVAFLAYQRRRWFWMAAVVGLTPLSRPEGFGFVVLAAVALLLHRRARWWAVLAVPLLAWDLAGWQMSGRPGHWWHWLADNWPYAGDSLYDRGPLLKFVALLPAIVGPFAFPATVIGAWLCLGGPWSGQAVQRACGVASGGPPPSGRLPDGNAGSPLHRVWRAFTTDHRVRCDVLIAVLPVLVLVGHSLLQWRGKMASNGEVRYMLVVAPFWGLLSARGWGWVFERFTWPNPRLWAAVAAAAPLLANRAYTVLPQRPSPDWVQAAQIAAWYKADAVKQYPHLAVAHPGLTYALDYPPSDPHLVDWKRPTIDAAPPGTLLVWDRVDGLFNASTVRSITLDEIRRAGWVPVRTRWTGGAAEWHFFHSPGGKTPMSKTQIPIKSQ